MSSEDHNPNPTGIKNNHPKVGRPLLFQSVEDLQKKIDAYFSDPESKPYTVSGLAYYLDCSRVTLLRAEYRDEFRNTIEKAKQRIEAFATQYLYKPGTAAGVIFNLYNNFDSWKQRQDVNVGGQEGNPVQIKIDFGDKDQECKK